MKENFSFSLDETIEQLKSGEYDEALKSNIISWLIELKILRKDVESNYKCLEEERNEINRKYVKLTEEFNELKQKYNTICDITKNKQEIKQEYELRLNKAKDLLHNMINSI